MKQGNWIGLLWALTGFLVLGFGLGTMWQWVGGVILASWLIFVFWSYLKK